MLEGRLGDFTLPDILRLLAFTAKTGRLWVGHESVQARVDVLEGRVRDASADASRLGIARRLLGQDLVDGDALRRALDGLDALPTDLELARRLVESEALDSGLLADLAREQVVDALFDLLRWEHGAFRFEATMPEARGPSALDLALPVDEVLDEVGRRLEAHATIEDRTGAADAVVTIRRPGRERAEVALNPEGWTLLALVDGHRTVGDLVALSGQGDYRTRRTLASLIDEGIVAVGDPQSLPPGERLLQAHGLLAEAEARLHGAEASLPGAEAPTDGPARPLEASVTADLAATEAPAVDVDVQPEPAPAAPETSAPVASDESAFDEPTPAAATTPPPAATPSPAVSDATGSEGQPAADAEEEQPTPAGVTPLRAKARAARLRTDPQVDEDLVRRLIDGVESL